MDVTRNYYNSLFVFEDYENEQFRKMKPPALKAILRSYVRNISTEASIACRALGIQPNDLLADLKSFGLFFEDMAVRGLSVYAAALRGEVKHYRDNTGLECDAVVHLEDG